MGDHDKKSRCEQCEYFGKASDAPETVEEDCMWQTCEDENCTLPCEKGAGMERLTEKNKCKLSHGGEIVKRKKGYQQGYNDGIDDFVEQITLPMDEEQIVDIVERLKHNFES